MDATKPYKFIGVGAMDVTKPYDLLWCGAHWRAKAELLNKYRDQLSSRGGQSGLSACAVSALDCQTDPLAHRAIEGRWLVIFGSSVFVEGLPYFTQ